MIVCLSSISLSLFLAQNPTDNTHHMLIVLAVFLPMGVRIVFLIDSIDTTDKIFGRSSFYLGNNNNTNKKCLSHTMFRDMTKWKLGRALAGRMDLQRG